MPTASAIVTAIDTAILALVANKIASYTVDGVTFTYENISDLRDLRTYYARLGRTAGSRRRLADISGPN